MLAPAEHADPPLAASTWLPLRASSFPAANRCPSVCTVPCAFRSTCVTKQWKECRYAVHIVTDAPRPQECNAVLVFPSALLMYTQAAFVCRAPCRRLLHRRAIPKACREVSSIRRVTVLLVLHRGKDASTGRASINWGLLNPGVASPTCSGNVLGTPGRLRCTV